MGFPKEWECVGFSEVDKHASAVLAFHYPNVRNYGDIKSIDWNKVPDFDVLTGGSPCQDFSIAGKRRGLSGSRSSLAWEFIRGLRTKQPRHFLWENVKGVMSSRGGWDFANLLCAFSESGYSLWWQVLNAKDFGVPQNRERIFVVGTRGERTEEVLFVPWATEEITTVGLIPEQYREGGNYLPRERVVSGLGIMRTVTTHESQMPYIQQINKPKHSIAVALRNKNRSKHQSKDGKKYGDFEKKYHLEPQREGLSFAVKETAHENWILGDNIIRRLTPIECERLMSWPSGHTKYGRYGDEVKEISDSQRYKMCGNGVVSAVVKEITKHLL